MGDFLFFLGIVLVCGVLWTIAEIFGEGSE